MQLKCDRAHAHCHCQTARGFRSHAPSMRGARRSGGVSGVLILRHMRNITMLKKVLDDGAPRRKCVRAAEILRAWGAWERIDEALLFREPCAQPLRSGERGGAARWRWEGDARERSLQLRHPDAALRPRRDDVREPVAGCVANTSAYDRARRRRRRRPRSLAERIVSLRKKSSSRSSLRERRGRSMSSPRTISSHDSSPRATLKSVSFCPEGSNS